jgi:hypothetical protein
MDSHFNRMRRRVGFTLLWSCWWSSVLSPFSPRCFCLRIAKSKKKAHDIRCHSNLRQLGIGLLQYKSDNDEKFPFSPARTGGGLARVGFVDFYVMLSRYLNTNGGFYMLLLVR